MTAPGSSGSGAAGGAVLSRAEASDLEAVEALLRSMDLPVAGVAEALSGFVVARAAGEVVGVAGLEIHGTEGVLRSVAVHASQRGRGMGERLTRWVVEEAARRGLRRLFLLTTTAEGYFPRLGFRPVDRAAAGPEVQASVEFREACPASAVAMVLDLTN